MSVFQHPRSCAQSPTALFGEGAAGVPFSHSFHPFPWSLGAGRHNIYPIHGSHVGPLGCLTLNQPGSYNKLGVLVPWCSREKWRYQTIYPCPIGRDGLFSIPCCSVATSFSPSLISVRPYPWSSAPWIEGVCQDLTTRDSGTHVSDCPSNNTA